LRYTAITGGGRPRQAVPPAPRAARGLVELAVIALLLSVLLLRAFLSSLRYIGRCEQIELKGDFARDRVPFPRPEMNEAELKSLKEYAIGRAHQLALEATVTYDDSDGFITVEVIKRAGDGSPISIGRAAKFADREQAEAVIDHVIAVAQLAGAPSR